MRRREPLDPEQLRELDAIDRALAGEPVDEDLRELGGLVLEVRASAPEMSPSLAARLERLAQDGPPSAAATAKPPRRSRRWVLVPALGTVAAVLVALVVVLGNSNGGSTPPSASDSTVSAIPPSRQAPSGKAAAASTATRGAVAIAPQRHRQVERSVFLALSTGKDKLESTSDGVVQTVDRFRGIVASSSINSDDTSGGQATFDLRIPTGRLDDALAALSKLGHVTERRQNLEDITASFTSAHDRLDEARAERRGLLKALGNATTQNRIDSLRARLRLVRARIASDEGQLASLQRRARYSKVNVTVQGDGKAGQGGGTWSPGDAAKDALRVLEVSVGIALIALAVALPLALLGAAILFGARMTRLRRRETALDAT